ncbi:MAG: hypothetical protein ABIL05_04945, partial [candidate division WOR-3 bacterium]
MKFWIDIVEPFSLNFLAVVINRLKELNHTVTITAPARQVLLSELDSKKIEYIMIDNRVNGRSRADRLGDLGRALRLAEFALDSRFDLGFSTGSLPQTIACNMVGLANLVIYDFSQKPPWLLLKLRTKMLVPDCIIDSLPEKIKEKVVGYPGFKESIYLGAVKYNH